MERGRRGVKVEGFIFLCISRYVQSGASLLSMYQEFSSKKFFIVVIGAVLRVMARRTSLAQQVVEVLRCVPCSCGVEVR